MAMVVKTNKDALTTLNNLNRNSNALSKSLSKVSTGMKINSAKDDASGYAISERMRVQIRSLDQANQNTQNGNSMMKTAEGAVSSTIEILKSLKDKAINAANDTNNTETDRATIQKEMDQFIDQIDDNANVTYNGKYMLDGTKNFKTECGTKSTYINMSLSTTTTASTGLTSLSNRAGSSLEIASTDTISISFVNGGKTYSTAFIVSTNANVESLSSMATAAKNDVGSTFEFASNAVVATTAGTSRGSVTQLPSDGQSAVVIEAKSAGVQQQISGLTIRITDQEGNVRKSATEAINNFNEVIHAEDSSSDNALTFHVGAKANNSIKVGLQDMRAEALGLRGSDGTKLNISTQEKAEAAISVLDSAISRALDQQTTIGAVQARLEYTSSNLTTASENVQASESTIRDADMAKEMTEYTKNNVLLQAAQSMLAQANQNSSAVLSLLQ
ncbi:MAG: flagellin [Selenomonadaceae bacterium]|nr:flagellin [Selenomonadaceae bacterium]